MSIKFEKLFVRIVWNFKKKITCWWKEEQCWIGVKASESAQDIRGGSPHIPALSQQSEMTQSFAYTRANCSENLNISLIIAYR